jgi:hypothetical protein
VRHDERDKSREMTDKACVCVCPHAALSGPPPLLASIYTHTHTHTHKAYTHDRMHKLGHMYPRKLCLSLSLTLHSHRHTHPPSRTHSLSNGR